MLIPWLQEVSVRVKLKNSSAVILPVSSLMKLLGQSWLLYKAAYPQSLHFCIFKVLNLSLRQVKCDRYSESVFTRCLSRRHLKRLHRIFSVITLRVTSSSLFFPTTFPICSVKNTKGTETNKEFITRLVILFKVSQLLSANIEVALEFWQNTPMDVISLFFYNAFHRELHFQLNPRAESVHCISDCCFVRIIRAGDDSWVHFTIQVDREWHGNSRL